MPRQSYINNPEFASASRERIFRVIIILFAVLFIGRLSYLQIIRGSFYRQESETQAIKKIIVEPFRGSMFDHNGELLVHNEPSFSIRITLGDFRLDRIPLLASILNIDTSEITSMIEKYEKFSKFEPIKIMRDVDFQTIALLEEYNDLLPGVDVSIESKRLYKFEGNMAHLMGYTKEISREQLTQMKYYKPGDVIGQSGLEATYDEILRGTKGINFIAVNRSGEKVSRFDDGKSDLPVSNGFDLVLTIDKFLQESTEKMLDGKRAAAIAIDPSNGEVLAMVSKPDYDLRAFSGKTPNWLLDKLNNDKSAPLLNRCIQTKAAPGSTWKMLIALAALQEGIINESSTINCSGSFLYGGRSFGCHGHGGVNVVSAISASCNVFFYNMGLRLGLEKFTKYGDMFGFGMKTYIDIPNEVKGTFPGVAYWAKRGKFNKGSMINYGIGQGEIEATPLQMACYVAAIANKGTMFQPHTVRAKFNPLTNRYDTFDFGRKNIPIDKKNFEIVQRGMYGVVNSPGGTATGVFAPFRSQLPNVSVYGKTGTAQNQGNDNAWFVCFAEKGEKRIAICVFVQNAGFGAVAAAPVAFQMLVDYYYPKSKEKTPEENKDSTNKNVITKNN